MIRLSPRDPRPDSFFSEIGRAQLLQSRTDEAIPWLEKARNATPAYTTYRVWLAAACALKGKTERAAVELAEAWRLSNRFPSIAGGEGVVLDTSDRRLARSYLSGRAAQSGMPED